MPRKGEQSIPISDFRKQRFLEWLCTPVAERDPSTMDQLAAEISLTRRTLTNWKDDPIFLAEWERRYRKTVGSPERAQAVLQTMFETATDREDPKHVQAGRAFLEAIDAVKPPTLNVNVGRKQASDLSDEELEAMIASRASDELAARRAEAEADDGAA